MEKKVIRLNDRLLEGYVRKTMERMMLLEAMSVDDIYTKYYSDLDRSVFNAAVKSDPSSSPGKPGRYVKWILNLYRNGSWKPGDSYETRDALSKFDRLKGKLDKKDINEYPSVKAVLDAVSDKKSTSDIKRSGAEKVYEDGEWLVIVPHTEEASKLYGKGTKWCTAADNDNYFDYYSKQGPLYINIRKRDGQKWQFHFESKSFMDAKDDPVRIKDIGLSDGLVKFYEKVCPYFKFLFDYDYVSNFQEGFAAVELNEKWNYIDTEGNLLSPDQWFDGYDVFYEGFARVELDGKWNFIETEGNILSPGRWFDHCDNFNEGFAWVELDGKCNFIDTNGKILSPDQWFDCVGNFIEGLATVDINGKWYYIDREGDLYDKNNNPIKKNNAVSEVKRIEGPSRQRNCQRVLGKKTKREKITITRNKISEMKKKSVKINQKDLDRIVSESIRKVVKNRKPLKEYFSFDGEGSDDMGYENPGEKTGPLDWYDVFGADFMQEFTTKCEEAFGGGDPMKENEVINMVDRSMELLLNNLNKRFRV